MSEAKAIRFFYTSAGEFLCDRPIQNVTQRSPRASVAMGYDYFICETISRSAAGKFAVMLGGELLEEKK